MCACICVCGVAMSDPDLVRMTGVQRHSSLHVLFPVDRDSLSCGGEGVGWDEPTTKGRMGECRDGGGRPC